MKCIYCSDGKTKVVDSRESEGKVRRRRECQSCGERFTTYETADDLDIQVIKGDGETEKFREEKIRDGLEKATNKTSLGAEEVEEIIEEVKKMVRGKNKVESEEIGNKIKEELSTRDEVAYIRFASVYESFEDAESFKEEVESLKSK
ncbi:transcriptional regulator NrdR [Candidatus Nanohalobium constans]|uniref:Transcriptional repressor NrdR n=1 Tax=Candidatus Nanohalobium constans TaxID=2565781 RepID=A0A5Q0UFM7_9ARCH|nr:transcriptional regulator NrdR [Candidatus Nanohalobium constans]QGA80398.1 transcriptional regulator NrdR [Candidatus Nanohalobium constans]